MSWYSEYPSYSNSPLYNESKLKFYIKQLPGRSDTQTEPQNNTNKKSTAVKRKKSLEEGKKPKKQLPAKKKQKSKHVTKDNFI